MGDPGFRSRRRYGQSFEAPPLKTACERTRDARGQRGQAGRLPTRDPYSARRKKAIGIGRGLAPSRRATPPTCADTSTDAGTTKAATIGRGRTWNW